MIMPVSSVNLSIGNNACKNQTDKEMIGSDWRGRVFKERASRDLF